MAEEHNMRRVTAIKNGTVIDHIPSGQALKVLELLKALVRDHREVRGCTFSNCITQNLREPLPHRLRVAKTDPLTLRCHYCQRPQDLDELVLNLL